MTILERLEMTVANIQHQNGTILWDDMEKLEAIVNQLQSNNTDASETFNF